MLRFLSPEWFAAARSGSAAARGASGDSTAVQFDVEGVRSRLVVRDGRVHAWELGECADAAAEIRWTRPDARAILSRALRGSDALAATVVVDDAGLQAPAPLGLIDRPELAALPHTPGATFAMQERLRNGPFGDTDYVLRFEEGRVVEERLGTTADADVFVDVTYRAMARVRTGEIGILDSLDHGSVSGDIGGLAMLAGILESPEFHAAELATGRQSLALATLGELDAEPAFAAAMEGLAVITEAP